MEVTDGRRKANENREWESQALVVWIKEYLERQDWNQSKFARAAGIDTSVLSRWLQGRRPRPELVRRMAKGLGVDEEDLLVRAGYRGQTTEETTPEQATLIAKLRQVHLTPDRFRILESLLDYMRQCDP